MKKRTRTSVPRPPRSKTTSKSPSNVWYVVGGIGAAILISALVLLAILFVQQRDTSLATVNGEEIDQAELDFQYNLLPESYKESFTKEQVLEQVIDETLVVQAAQRSGITVSNEEVLERVQGILAANEISIADLQENLAQFNVTQEQFEELIRRQIIIERYLNRTLESEDADEATLQALYSTTQSQYQTPEQVTVQHVLISSQRTDAALVAKNVYDLARDGTDFCELAANNSDDRGSRDTCGAYTFPRGFMDPVFEEAAFSMADEEIRLIQTQFGYHVLKRVSLTPAGVRSYEEVRPELVAQYESADRSQQYRRLISELRSTATIIYANGTRIVPQQPSTVAPAEPVAPQEPVQPEQPVDPQVPEELPAEPVLPEPVAPEPVAPVQPEPVQPVEQNTGSLFACIASKAVLYGTSWSTDTQEARRLFERQDAALNYVECNTGGSCAGITAYPTWVINGQQYVGRMSAEQLANAAGC